MKFEEWFQYYLINHTESCNDRDVFRWAKPVLELGFKVQSYTDIDLDGSQELIDAWMNKTLEPQNDELKKEIAKLKELLNVGLNELTSLEGRIKWHDKVKQVLKAN